MWRLARDWLTSHKRTRPELIRGALRYQYCTKTRAIPQIRKWQKILRSILVHIPGIYIYRGVGTCLYALLAIYRCEIPQKCNGNYRYDRRARVPGTSYIHAGDTKPVQRAIEASQAHGLQNNRVSTKILDFTSHEKFLDRHLMCLGCVFYFYFLNNRCGVHERSLLEAKERTSRLDKGWCGFFRHLPLARASQTWDTRERLRLGRDRQLLRNRLRTAYCNQDDNIATHPRDHGERVNAERRVYTIFPRYFSKIFPRHLRDIPEPSVYSRWCVCSAAAQKSFSEIIPTGVFCLYCVFTTMSLNIRSVCIVILNPHVPYI